MTGAASRLDLRIDVTEAAAMAVPVQLAVTVYLPDPATLPRRPVAIFALPGGGYSRGYFSLSFAGHVGYNESEFHVGYGTVHVAVDPVGVGESTIPDLAKIGFHTLAATHDSCVRQIAARLEAGTLAVGFPALPALFRVGMGQSMGGGVTILAQGRFATFDAIAACGVSAIHTVLPQPSPEAVERVAHHFANATADKAGHSHETIDHGGVDYVYAFHWEDVPTDIVYEDMRGGYPVRQTAPAFGSTTLPHCAVQMLTSGCFAEDAARIAVPVFIGNGERDTCPDPHAEPAAYPASRDISLFIVPTMAHMHNFASTRRMLWTKLHAWSRQLTKA